jgi:hypothetical protein
MKLYKRCSGSLSIPEMMELSGFSEGKQNCMQSPHGSIVASSLWGSSIIKKRPLLSQWVLPP